jgi:polar amino acid transport system substrate-binding protein
MNVMFKNSASVMGTNILLSAIVCLLVLLPILVSAVQPDTPTKNSLIINSGSSSPLTIDDNYGFYPDLVNEIFTRLNVPIFIRHTQSSSSLKNVNQGRDDGVIVRIKGLEKKLTNLIRIPEKVIELEFIPLSNDKNIKIETWDDLKDYNIAYIKGWKIFDNKVMLYKSLTKAKNMTQLLQLLQKKRVDVILSQRIVSQSVMKQLNYFPYMHSPLAKREMFIYMHKKNKKLVPKIESELKKIKQDGTYNKIYKKNIN